MEHTKAIATDILLILDRVQDIFIKGSVLLEQKPVHVNRNSEKPFVYPRVYIQPSSDVRDNSPISILPAQDRQEPWVYPDRWMDLSFISDSMAFCKLLAMRKSLFKDNRSDYITTVQLPPVIASAFVYYYAHYVQSLGKRTGSSVLINGVLEQINKSDWEKQGQERDEWVSLLWRDLQARIFIYYGIAVSHLLVDASDSRGSAYKIMLYSICCDIMSILSDALKADTNKGASTPFYTALVVDVLFQLEELEKQGTSTAYAYMGHARNDHDIYESVFAKKTIVGGPIKSLIDLVSTSSFWSIAKQQKPRVLSLDKKAVLEFARRIVSVYTSLKVDTISTKISYWWDLASKALVSLEEEEEEEEYDDGESMDGDNSDAYGLPEEYEDWMESHYSDESIQSSEGRLKKVSNNYGDNETGANNNNNNNNNLTTSNNNTNTANQNITLTISDLSSLMETDEGIDKSGEFTAPSTYGGHRGKRKRQETQNDSPDNQPYQSKRRKTAEVARKRIFESETGISAQNEENKEGGDVDTRKPEKPKRPRGRPKKSQTTEVTPGDPLSDQASESYDGGIDIGPIKDALINAFGGMGDNNTTTTTGNNNNNADANKNGDSSKIEGTVSNLTVKEEKIKPTPIESMIGVDETIGELSTLALRIKYSGRFNFEESRTSNDKENPAKEIIQSSVLRGGLMLFGPPGGGKTIMASVLVDILNTKQIKAHFFNEGPSKILSPYVGESEKYVDTLFRVANDTAEEDNLIIQRLKTQGADGGQGNKNAIPQAVRESLKGFEKSISIIYIDEADSVLTPTTGINADSARNSVVTTFQSAILGNKPINYTKFVASTNFPWKIPLPIRQRFSRSIYIGVPDDESRYLKILYRIYQRLYKRDGLQLLGLNNNTTKRRIEIMEEKLAPEFAKIDDCVSIVNRFAVEKFGVLLGLKPITLDWIKYYLIPIIGRRNQIKSQALRDKISLAREYIIKSPASGRRVFDIESDIDRLYNSQYLGTEPDTVTPQAPDKMETDGDRYYSTASPPSSPKTDMILRDDSEEVKFNSDDEGIGGIASYEESNDAFQYVPPMIADDIPNAIHREVALDAPIPVIDRDIPVVNITVNVGNETTIPLVNNTNIMEPNKKLSGIKAEELKILKRFAESTISADINEENMAIPNELADAIYAEFGGFDDFLKTMEDIDAAPMIKLGWPSPNGSTNSVEFTWREAIQIVNEHHLAQRGVAARNNMTKLEFGLSLRELDQKISTALDSCTELIHTLPYPTKYLFSPNVPIERLQVPNECKFILDEYKDYLHFASGYWSQLYTPQKYTPSLKTPEGSLKVGAEDRVRTPKPISEQYPPVFDEQDFNFFNFYNPAFNTNMDRPSDLQISPYLITRNAFTSALSKLDPSLDPETHAKYVVYSKTK